MELVFVEHTSPEDLIKTTISANVRICRKMLLFLIEDAFERGNDSEVRIQP